MLPVSLQKQLNLKEGDHFILIVETDKTLRLVSLGEQVRKIQGLFKDIAPDVISCSSFKSDCLSMWNHCSTTILVATDTQFKCILAYQVAVKDSR